MKKIAVIIMTCAIVIAFSACKKVKDKDYISAEIDGAAFYMDNTDSNGLASSTSEYGFIGAKPTLAKIVFIKVHNIDGTQISINVDSSYTGEGTYSLTAGGSHAWCSIGGSIWSCQSIYPASSGTLTVTSETSNSIEGTFEFTGACYSDCDNGPIKHIANGKFKMPLLHY